MSEINSIIVFGPTGTTGLHILKRAILEGLEVTVYVRNPKKIPESICAKLYRIIQGDVLDKTRVENAIEGHDAVLSALGQGGNNRDNRLLSEGCQNIVSGMKKHNVTKLVIVSMGTFLTRERPRFNRFWKRIGFYDDHQRQIKILEEERESIDWIMMMPSNIRNSTNINPDYKVEKNNIPGEYSVTAGELADFMVKVFMDRTSTECFKHTKLGISSYPKRKFSCKISMSVAMGLFAFAIGAMLYYRMLPDVLQEFVDNVTNHGTDAIKDQ
uniref:flavin reductase (NADPH)-like isoform X1 n=1 Tax=Styela clava TaxID=7725 RepID=UPI001939F102|nr:flavin reductase (NADPH)-like isoform X1 [Styela clava]